MKQQDGPSFSDGLDDEQIDINYNQIRSEQICVRGSGTRTHNTDGPGNRPETEVAIGALIG